jgi:hypothetical protein
LQYKFYFGERAMSVVVLVTAAWFLMMRSGAERFELPRHGPTSWQTSTYQSCRVTLSQILRHAILIASISSEASRWLTVLCNSALLPLTYSSPRSCPNLVPRVTSDTITVSPPSVQVRNISKWKRREMLGTALYINTPRYKACRQ